MEDLENVFNAVRSFEGDNLHEASEKVDVSKTMLNNFFKGYATSAPLEKRIRKYIKESRLYNCIRQLGLEPYTKVGRKKSKTPSV